MLNRCDFIGNLGRDPEVRSTQSGQKIVNLNLAVSEKWRDASGEQKERTEWVRVVIWNEKLGEIAEKYLTKGSRCYVSGQLHTRKWTDQSGAEKYSTEIVLQRFNGTLVLLGGGEKSGGDYGQREAYKSSGGGGALDDEIPFAPCTEV